MKNLCEANILSAHNSTDETIYRCHGQGCKMLFMHRTLDFSPNQKILQDANSHQILYSIYLYTNKIISGSSDKVMLYVFINNSVFLATL